MSTPLKLSTITKLLLNALERCGDCEVTVTTQDKKSGVTDEYSVIEIEPFHCTWNNRMYVDIRTFEKPDDE